VDFRHAALPAVSADDFRRVTMTCDQCGHVILAAYSDGHWRRTRLSCYGTLILLALATFTLTSVV
jgi:ribosomal protein S27AE